MSLATLATHACCVMTSVAAKYANTDELTASRPVNRAQFLISDFFGVVCAHIYVQSGHLQHKPSH